MRVTAADAAAVRQLTTRSVSRLAEASCTTAVLAEYIPPRKRLIGTRKAKLIAHGEVWPLGALLLGVDGVLAIAGESTRAVPPGHPGHVSAERERRRAFTRLAFESGVGEGRVVYFDSPVIDLSEGAELPAHSVITQGDHGLAVRWNRAFSSAAPVPLDRYLEEQVLLKIELAERSAGTL